MKESLRLLIIFHRPAMVKQRRWYLRIAKDALSLAQVAGSRVKETYRRSGQISTNQNCALIMRILPITKYIKKYLRFRLHYKRMLRLSM